MRPWQWYEILTTGKLTNSIPPRSAELITDFSHYNASVSTDRGALYEGGLANWRGQKRNQTWSPRTDVRFEREPIGNLVSSQGTQYNDNFFDRNEAATKQDGLHWVGDLACELDLKLSANEGLVTIDLVEAGTHYLLQLNAADKTAQLRAVRNNTPQAVFESSEGAPVAVATASTSFSGGSDVRIKFANIDDTLHVWLDDDLVEFTPSSKVVTSDVLDLEDHTLAIPHKIVPMQHQSVSLSPMA